MSDFNRNKQMALAMALKGAPQPMAAQPAQPMGAADYPDVAPPQMMGPEDPQTSQDLASVDAALEALRASGLHMSDPNYTPMMRQLYETRDQLRAPQAPMMPQDQMLAGR